MKTDCGEESDVDNLESDLIPSTSDAMAAVKIITLFFLNNDVDPSVINIVLIVESEIERLILSKIVLETKVTKIFYVFLTNKRYVL